MIHLYEYQISPFCDKIRRILNFKKIEYKRYNISGFETLFGKLNRLSPTGKVPVIVDDSTTIWDSTNIANYIEKKYPSPPLVFKNKRSQSEMHFLEDWADESLFFYEIMFRFVFKKNRKKWTSIATKNDSKIIKFIAPYILPKSMKKIALSQGIGRKSTDEVINEFSTHINHLADYLNHSDWLVGKRISIADIAVFCQLSAIKDTNEGKSEIQKQPLILEWMNRVDNVTK